MHLLSRLFAFFCIFSLNVSILAQNPKGLSPIDRMQLSSAHENFRADYFTAALQDYENLAANYPKNVTLKFFQAKTMVHLWRYEEAFTLLEEIWNSDSTCHELLPYYYGWMLFRFGILDKAEPKLEQFLKSLKPKDRKTHEANVLLKQIAVAYSLQQKPSQAKIKGLDHINSDFNESGASLTADGLMMVFTASRPETTGGGKDPMNGLYFQDIYISFKDSTTGVWDDPIPIPGEVNTPGHDASTSISPDGNILFTFNSQKGGGDIMYSRIKKNGQWRTPVNIEGSVNNSYFESSANLSADGKTLFFISEKPGKKSKGEGDVWMARKKGKFEFIDAEPIEVLNSIHDENSVFIHPNGELIFFSSNRAESMGGYDIFYSRKANGKWSQPINMGSPINSVGDEIYFYITPDGEKAYLTSRRPESMNYSYDIFEVDLTNYVYPDSEINPSNVVPISKNNPSVYILKGKIISREKAEPMSVVIKIYEESGQLINEISSGEGGNYLTTIPKSGNYYMEISHPEFKMVKENFTMPFSEGKTEIVVRAFTLERE
jgi:hypothetical protein